MPPELAPLVTFLSMLASAGISAAALGVWLMRQFLALRLEFAVAIERQRVSLEAKIDAHEDVDQGRHHDNLREFRELDTSVTRLEAQLEYRLPPSKH